LDNAPSSLAAFRHLADFFRSLAEEVDPSNKFSEFSKEAAGAPTKLEISPKDLEAKAPLFASMAMRQIESRKRRRFFVDIDTIGEPGWQIILDMFVHDFSGKSVSITSACMASGCPSSTALRYVAILENASLVERHPSKTDKRVSYLTLTRNCRIALHDYFLKESQYETKRLKAI
jgi:hypothetical protein